MVQQKGGVGKTTNAVGLAGAISQRRLSVALVDADPAGAAVDWGRRGSLPFPVIAAPMTKFSDWVRLIEEIEADIIVMDTPPGLTETMTAAAMLADLVLCPVGTSTIEHRQLSSTLGIIEAVREFRGFPLHCAILPTRLDSRVMESRTIKERLAPLGVEFAPAQPATVLFGRAHASGVSPHELLDLASARSALEDLTNFVLEILLEGLHAEIRG